MQTACCRGGARRARRVAVGKSRCRRRCGRLAAFRRFRSTPRRWRSDVGPCSTEPARERQRRNDQQKNQTHWDFHTGCYGRRVRSLSGGFQLSGCPFANGRTGQLPVQSKRASVSRGRRVCSAAGRVASCISLFFNALVFCFTAVRCATAPPARSAFCYRVLQGLRTFKDRAPTPSARGRSLRRRRGTRSDGRVRGGRGRSFAESGGRRRPRAGGRGNGPRRDARAARDALGDARDLALHRNETKIEAHDVRAGDDLNAAAGYSGGRRRRAKMQ